MAGKNVKGFTLVEVLIVVAILGILGSLAYPQFEGYVQQAKEAAAKDNLRVLRNAIELYSSQHNDIPPGYVNGNMILAVSFYFNNQMLLPTNALGHTGQTRSSEYPYGPYLSLIPKNPFTDSNDSTVWIVQATQDMPAQADGTTAWICKPAAKEIRLNKPGTDSEGVRYYDY